jgi:hypothetical protein
MSLPRRVVAEGLGTAFLLAVVIGSGIMGERLAAGNSAIALLANSLATGGGDAALALAASPTETFRLTHVPWSLGTPGERYGSIALVDTVCWDSWNAVRYPLHLDSSTIESLHYDLCVISRFNLDAKGASNGVPVVTR